MLANMQQIVRVLFVAGIVGYGGWTSVRSFRHVWSDMKSGGNADIRRLAKFNPLRGHDWKTFPAAFEDAFEPRVEGRDIYVRRFARFKLESLGVSPRPKVWLGRDGWLFFNHEADPNYLSVDDPRLEDRIDAWARALPEWRAWLAERGIRFLIVVAPDKQSVYDNRLPALQQKLRRAAPLDDILRRWRAADPRLEVVDLRPILRAARDERLVYYRTDTHWTPTGAMIGYHQTARAIGFKPLSDPAFSGDVPAQRAGDIAGQLGFWREGPETFANRRLNERTARPVSIADSGDTTVRLDYLNSRCWENDRGQRAVLFHDSFGDGFYAELLAEHCTRLLAVPSNHLDPIVIEREKPDVVILEIVERLFQGVSPRRPGDPPRRSMVR